MRICPNGEPRPRAAQEESRECLGCLGMLRGALVRMGCCP